MFPGFRDIGEAYGPFDLTMLEIGAYDADWPDIHMGPIHAAASAPGSARKVVVADPLGIVQFGVSSMAGSD